MALELGPLPSGEHAETDLRLDESPNTISGSSTADTTMGNDTPFGIDSSYIGSRRSSVVSAKLASAARPPPAAPPSQQSLERKQSGSGEKASATGEGEGGDASSEGALGSKRWHGRRARSKRARKGDTSKSLVSRLVEVPQQVLVVKLLVFLEARDLLSISMTCSSLQRASDDPRLWRRLLFLDFSGPRLSSGAMQDFPMPHSLIPFSTAGPRNGPDLDLERGFGSGALLTSSADLESDSTSDLPPISSTSSQQSQPQGQSQIVTTTSSPAATPSWPSWSRPFGGSPVVRPTWAQSLRRSSSSAAATPAPDTDRATVNEADAQATPGRFAPCREKAVYLQQIYDYEERVRLAAMEVIINEEIREISAFRARTERRIRAISWDLTTPMIGICPLLLFILVALSMDGRLDGSIWVIMTPLFFLFGLFAVGICMGAVLYFRSSKSDSLFYGMYPNYRGFIQFWMHKVFREDPVAMCSGVVLYVSLVLFVIFIGMRVEASTTWPWMAIFSPFWIMLLIFALSPVLRWCGAHEDMDDFKTPYLVLMFSVWLPVTVFAIALPLYLDRYVSVSIAVVLIPLWVFEGELLIFLFVTLAQSLYTRKDISDSLLVVVVMLVIFAPLVAFQVLLVIKFDAAGEPLTWMEVFTPLFVWFSICTLYLINVTVYDEAPSRAELSMTHPKMLEKMSLQLAANNTRGNAADGSSSSSSRLGPPLPRHRGVSIAAPEAVRRSASERARASRAASSSRP